MPTSGSSPMRRHRRAWRTRASRSSRASPRCSPTNRRACYRRGARCVASSTGTTRTCRRGSARTSRSRSRGACWPGSGHSPTPRVTAPFFAFFSAPFSLTLFCACFLTFLLDTLSFACAIDASSGCGEPVRRLKPTPRRDADGTPGPAHRLEAQTDDAFRRHAVTKYVYDFSEGNKDMKDLLGGKGANLAEMTNMGLAVPHGFTITTEACLPYLAEGGQPEGLMGEVDEHLEALESSMGKTLGDAGDPLLVSVRSGAKFSMPGMMDTVLNLGLNEGSVAGLAAQTGDDLRFARDAHRRVIQMFGQLAMGVPADRA